LFLIMTVVAVIILIGIDYFTWRQFHRMDAFEARFEGLYNIVDDVPEKDFVKMFKTTMKEKIEFKKSA
jgi:heme/copper-type cytochrome/quinol oxidase subunit 2